MELEETVFKGTWCAIAASFFTVCFDFSDTHRTRITAKH